MVPFKHEITIDCPLDRVFRLMADPQNYPKWMNGVESANSISDPPGGTGSRVRIVGRVGPMKLDDTMEITEREPNRKIALRTSPSSPIQFDGSWLFEPYPSSKTRVIVAGNVGLQGIWRLLEPLMAGEMKDGEYKELQKVKQLLERP